MLPQPNKTGKWAYFLGSTEYYEQYSAPLCGEFEMQLMPNRKIYKKYKESHNQKMQDYSSPDVAKLDTDPIDSIWWLHMPCS